LASPWVPKGLIVHEPPTAPTNHYELSSIPATLRKIFGFANPLTARDAYAAQFDDVWNGPNAMKTPRTDCPVVLPPAPPASPVHMGENTEAIAETKRVSDLQREMMVLAEGTAAKYGLGKKGGVGHTQQGTLAGAEAQTEIDAALERLRESGAFDSEAAAGRYMVARWREIMAAAKATTTSSVTVADEIVVA